MNLILEKQAKTQDFQENSSQRKFSILLLARDAGFERIVEPVFY